MEHWFHLRLQGHDRRRLRHPVSDIGDGAFILPLLQSGVWMFLFVMRICAVLEEPR